MNNVSTADLYAIPHSDNHATAKDLSKPKTPKSDQQLLPNVKVLNRETDRFQQLTVESPDPYSTN